MQIYAAAGEQPWQMVIDNQAVQAERRTYKGLLAQSKDKYYTIVPVINLEKNGKVGTILGGSVGFEFYDPAGKPVAAVSMMNNGMVFMVKTDPGERFLLASACAALLLQQEID